jgi:hypothetical protein
MPTTTKTPTTQRALLAARKCLGLCNGPDFLIDDVAEIIQEAINDSVGPHQMYWQRRALAAEAKLEQPRSKEEMI